MQGIHKKKVGNYKRILLVAFVAFCLLTTVRIESPLASFKGTCSDCHTMHNSQDGGAMTFEDLDTPNEYLLQGTCYGCHAMNQNSSTYDLSSDVIPQVLHTDFAKDLAGGNFGYIVPNVDNRGHNISDLPGISTDDDLFDPPGLIGFAHMGRVNTNTLTCAGKTGCHGYRNPDPPLPDGVKGAHHSNIDGKLDLADEPGNSYRFLMGVKGYEDSDWELTKSESDHNEYFGLTEPIKLNTCDGTNGCHSSAGIRPPDGTMSQFCATCHGNFHTLGFGGEGEDGIGTTATSPFIRHPTDLALPDDDGEYTFYTTYDPQVPVARTIVPDNSSQDVAPLIDVVMCLSCHRAHASEYPDMLRWDYTKIIAASGDDTEGGCFVCHTTKDDP